MRDAMAEYAKRLQAYCRFEVIEFKDEKITQNMSNADVQAAVSREGERLLSKMSDGFNITMEIDGSSLTSPAFAGLIQDKMNGGCSCINFIIGGSNGLSEAVRRAGDYKLSFSEMTFPHQLFRVMLTEQIYRAFKINRGETYHK